MTKRSINTLVRLLSDLDQLDAGAEVGVWKGQLSVVLLQKFPNLTLHMVDPWIEAPGTGSVRKSGEEMNSVMEEALRNTEFAATRRVVHSMTSEAAHHLILDGELDFVFIDACHDYENVAQDLCFWSDKIREGGILSGHDYDGRGDKEFGWGVKRAVDEFADANGFEVHNSNRVWWFE